MGKMSNGDSFAETVMEKRLLFMTRFCLLILFFLWIFFPPSAKADPNHTVKPGESLYGISKRYHLSVEEVLRANELADEKIHPGQKLVITGTTVSGEKSLKSRNSIPKEAAEEPADRQIPKTHKVKKGESLATIAEKYDLALNDLKELNDLKGKRVKTGQVLRLRLEEDDDDFGSEQGEDEGVWTARQNDITAYVQGSGFLAGEKSRELVARAAKSFLGFRYTRGGSSVNGMDCSSYVQRVYRIFGVDLPSTAREQFQIGYGVARNALKVGDLVFFKRTQARQPTHVGIYLGDNQFIHTSLKKKQVEIESTESGYFKARFMGAKRIEEVEAKIESKSPNGE
jgi:peptidoglycan endopeptidase LytE